MIGSKNGAYRTGLFIALLFAILAGLLVPSVLSADSARQGAGEIITADRFEGRIEPL